MSIFSELIPKINEISKSYNKNFNDDLKAIFERFDKFEEEYQTGKSRAREKAPKEKLTMNNLQSINEDEGETNKMSDTKRRSSNKSDNVEVVSVSSDGEPRRRSKKRSKNEVDGIHSPELDKRQKRNASVKAQSIISKQVNVNLSQKLRRETSTEKVAGEGPRQSTRPRRRKDDKENVEPNTETPAITVQVKQEKISIPPEPMDTESLPINIELKQEVDKDDVAMPPPAAPLPKSRKAAAAKADPPSEEDTSTRRRTTRNKKQTDVAPQTESPRRGSRQTRATRTRKASEASSGSEKDVTQSQETQPAVKSPAEKTRPKRTRRAQKLADKEELQKKSDETPTVEPLIQPKQEKLSVNEISSPILQKDVKTKNKTKHNVTTVEIEASISKDISKNVDLNELDCVGSKLQSNALDDTKVISKHADQTQVISKTVDESNAVSKHIDQTVVSKTVDETKITSKPMDETQVISKPCDMDATMVLQNGVYNHTPLTPQQVKMMNATVVLERHSDTAKPQNTIMDATVVIEKAVPSVQRVTDDDSLLTDDSDSPPTTPPSGRLPPPQPTSAVKEKVQQFEQLASRVTRTKTRAMAKKTEGDDFHTPPEKAPLAPDTLQRMDSLIFNGQSHQKANSTTKLRAPAPLKLPVTASTSKLSALSRARDAAEESLKLEDARRKKEALLEAKRDLQKRKREEKMAAAAAAREAAEKQRAAAAALAADQHRRLQQHRARDQLQRQRDTQRKKEELARKALETEERRRAEEAARAHRLALEQKRADEQRARQIQEQEAMKKEAALMTKEIEKRHREYMEKQKLKRLEEKNGTPLRSALTAASRMEPVYMCDGFQYLLSDEDEEPPPRPLPAWSTPKARKQQLEVQSLIASVHIDRLFSVRVHSPDLRDIFPNIDRSRLKRTSSAVWRTPPPLGTVAE